MNPHLFCRERTYHKTLLLSYSFDPIFFEQVVLPDLWAGRSGDILAIVDRGQIFDAIGACSGQLWHLGRNYLLAPADHAGAFHPKVILRLGANDGAVLIGSGNLTSSGWGGNQELAIGWMVGPGHSDDGAWLRGFLADVSGWCNGELEREAMARMRDVPWLAAAGATNPTQSVMYSRQEMALAPMLERRWSGRRFDSVSVLTGSTDESGAFLRWAHATFGIRRAVVALTPTLASFDLKQLNNLPVELSLVAAPPDRPMHAKFYWFDGEDGAAAVMGSANCSAAAWLLPPARGGNIETVVVYDAATREAFNDVLRVFDQPGSTPQEFLGTTLPTPPQSPPSPGPFRLLGLRWDKDAGLITASIAPHPDPGHSVQLLLGSLALTMAAPNGPLGHWTVPLIEEPTSGTAFACVRIDRGTDVFTTAPRWIDDLVLLRNASQSARLIEPFNGFERRTTSVEQRQMLEDLHEVAHALFSDTSSFPDPGAGTARENAGEASPAAPVNPNDLICHLEAGPSPLAHFGDARPGSLSIGGILSLLFAAERDAPGDAIASDDAQFDEGTGEPDLGSAGGTNRDRKEPEGTSRSIETRFRERLAAQISTFLANLRSSDFARRCSATQMVQAIAFPLAVALRGQRHDWVSTELAETWALDIVALLFRGIELDGEGLLHVVERRYHKNGQEETFKDVVGDGTLWMVLVATVGNSRWAGPGMYMEQAIALKEVFTAPQLLASARPERISGLLGKISIDNARRYLVDVAPVVTKLLDSLETHLRLHGADEARSQTERRIIHKTGDVLWRDNVGWALCLEDNALANNLPTRLRLRGHEKKVIAGYYVNVCEFSTRDATVGRLLEQLRSLIEVERL